MKRLHIILIALFVIIALPVYYVYDISTVHIKVKDHKILVDGDEVKYLSGDLSPSGDSDSSLDGKLYGVNSKGRTFRIFLADRGYALNQKFVIHFEADQDMDKYLSIFEVVHPPSDLITPWAVMENDGARAMKASFVDVAPGPRSKERAENGSELERKAREEFTNLFLNQHFTIYLTGKTLDQKTVWLPITKELLFLDKIPAVTKEDIELLIDRVGRNKRQEMAAKKAARAAARRRPEQLTSIMIKVAFSKNEIRTINWDSIHSFIRLEDGRFDFDQIQKELKSLTQGTGSDNRLVICAESGVDCQTVLTFLDLTGSMRDLSGRSAFQTIAFQRIMRISKNEIIYADEPELAKKSLIVERLAEKLDEEATLGVQFEDSYGIEFDIERLVLVDPDAPYHLFEKGIYTTQRAFIPVLIAPIEHTNPRPIRMPNRSWDWRDVVECKITVNDSGTTLTTHGVLPKGDMTIPSVYGLQDFQAIARNLNSITAAIQQSSHREVLRNFVLDVDDRADVKSIITIIELARRSTEFRVYFNFYLPFARPSSGASTSFDADFVGSESGSSGLSVIAGDSSGLIGVGFASIRGGAGVSAGDIQMVIDQNATAVNSCYRKELKKSPDLKGKLSVQIKVNPAGKVSGVTMTENTIGDAVAQCITNKIRGWSFPRSKKGVVTINETFVFRK